MMSKVPFHNDTDKIKHVGPVTLFPGDTREVEETDIPDFKAPEAGGESKQDPLLMILEGKAPEVIDVLPDLTPGELDALQLAEQAGKSRKGVLEAIAEEFLVRANAAKEAEEFAALIADMSDDDLDKQRELMAGDDGMLALIDAEIAKRAE